MWCRGEGRLRCPSPTGLSASDTCRGPYPQLLRRQRATNAKKTERRGTPPPPLREVARMDRRLRQGTYSMFFLFRCWPGTPVSFSSHYLEPACPTRGWPDETSRQYHSCPACEDFAQGACQRMACETFSPRKTKGQQESSFRM